MVTCASVRLSAYLDQCPFAGFLQTERRGASIHLPKLAFINKRCMLCCYGCFSMYYYVKLELLTLRITKCRMETLQSVKHNTYL